MTVTQNWKFTAVQLQRDELEFAIVSAYVYNFPWLYSMIKPETPVIAVAQDPQGMLHACELRYALMVHRRADN